MGQVGRVDGGLGKRVGGGDVHSASEEGVEGVYEGTDTVGSACR